MPWSILILFINIEPEFGERYQGIICACSTNSLAGCLMQYYDLSAQIPTKIVLSSTAERSGGLLIQLLPRNSEEEQQRVDEDLWPRLTILTETLKAEDSQIWNRLKFFTVCTMKKMCVYLKLND